MPSGEAAFPEHQCSLKGLLYSEECVDTPEYFGFVEIALLNTILNIW